ncbi:MAG: hypothetical protein K940chlam7_01568, partial [Chlamydiae bacterium]|nr:hypothetical protein [Chlamydiota bacterium]
MIQGLLDPNPKTRLTAEKALAAPCFGGLKKETQAHVFEDLQAEKLIQMTGMSRDEVDLTNYGFVSRAASESVTEHYYTQDHKLYYDNSYGKTPDDVSAYQKTPDHVTNEPSNKEENL